MSLPKDKDTGFQGFLDSEGWNNITVTGPDGNLLNLTSLGKLGQLGLSELFFETVEPENADVPIDEVLKTLPEGNYTFEGSAIEAGEKQGETIGTAMLTHDIPEGPELLSPAENATVPEAEDLHVAGVQLIKLSTALTSTSLPTNSLSRRMKTLIRT